MIRVGVRRGIVQVGNEQTGIRVSIVADLQNVARIHAATITEIRCRRTSIVCRQSNTSFFAIYRFYITAARSNNS